MTRFPKAARSLLWIASSYKDYRQFPPEVQETFGFELFLAQIGQRPPSAKPLKGIASGVIELVERFDGDAYRAVYTVQFDSAVYVLHAFQKKSKQGVKTPKSDVDLIRRRLEDAEAVHLSRARKE